MHELRTLPRVLLSALSGGSGKTLVSLGLVLGLRWQRVTVTAFKKGPGYIDTAWLGWASGRIARNLDTFMMGAKLVSSSFVANALTNGVNVIEGARGFFDGFDAAGTHSTAALARILKTPTVLILGCTKMTRTAAALVLGCQMLDADRSIQGVILNNVNGRRHEQILRGAIISTCGVPVLGAIPKDVLGEPLPQRHLGLVPPQEFGHFGRTGAGHS